MELVSSDILLGFSNSKINQYYTGKTLAGIAKACDNAFNGCFLGYVGDHIGVLELSRSYVTTTYTPNTHVRR